MADAPTTEVTHNHELWIVPTRTGRYPYLITCPECGDSMSRLPYRRGVVYRCSNHDCEAETTLDPKEVARLKAARKVRP